MFLTNRWFVPLLLLAISTAAAAGCYNGTDSDADDGEDGLSDAPSDAFDGPEDADVITVGPAFAQPTGLALVGLDELGVTTVYYATAGATGGFGQFPLTDPGEPAPRLPMPTVDRVAPTEAKPFTPMSIEGTGFSSHPDAAISVVFEAPGLAPVAVPVLIVTDTTLTFVAPVLLGPDGLDARGTASIRVIEVLGDDRAVSAPFDGVTIERLPPLDDGAPPPGTLTATLLLRAAEHTADSLRATERMLPPDFVNNATALSRELAGMAASIQAAAEGNPTSVPPWSGSEPPVLDAATLDFMDRLVFTALLAPTAAIQADAEAAARTAVDGQKAAPYGCPELLGTPEEKMESLLCMHYGHPAAMARIGQPAVTAGFQAVGAVFLGFWGGSAAAVLAVRSGQAALAFEVVWSGLTGHLTAWMTGQQRPSAGQTLADSGVTLADRLLRAGGSLDTLSTAISFGRSYDALVREAAATHVGDTGIDAGIDGGGEVDAADISEDEGDDVDEGDATISDGLRYEGEATLYGDSIQIDENCVGVPSVDLTVVITDFSGAGTASQPYAGRVTVSGTLTVIGCGGAAGLAEIRGAVGGLQGGVGFDMASGAPPRYEVAFSRGLVERPTKTLTGDLLVEFWPEGRFWFGVDGTIELSEID